MRSHHFGTSFTHFDPFIGANFRFGSGRIGTQTALNTVVAHVAGIAGAEKNGASIGFLNVFDQKTAKKLVTF